MPDVPKRPTRWLVTVVKVGVVVLVLWAVRATLLEAWAQLGEYRWSFQVGWLVASGAIYLVALLPAALFWHHVLTRMGQQARLGESLRAYYISHLGKYVPGKVMVVVLRTALVRSARVEAPVAAVCVFFETLTMMAVGAVLAAAILATWFRDQWLLALIALGLMAAAGLPTVPPVFRRLVRAARVGRTDPAVAEKIARAGFRTVALGWLYMTVGWCLMALSLWAVLMAMGFPDLDAVRQFPRYVASVSLAIVAGFLSLVPGGAVVREAVLSELLVPYFATVGSSEVAPAAAVVSAVMLRVVWLIAELVASFLLYFGARPGDVPPASSIAEELSEERNRISEEHSRIR